VGSPSGGHYTAYARHPVSSQWHYFNDSQVSEKRPEGEGQDDAYVLFYRRSGLSYTVNLPPREDTTQETETSREKDEGITLDEDLD